MLPGPSSRSTNFDGELILQSIFLVISFVLEQQAWFRVCVVPMVPITFCFIIPLTWCHRRSVTSSWNLSTNVSWSSSTFWGLPRYLSNSWWEIPSFALDGLGYHPQHYCIPSNTKIVHVLCCTLSSLLSNLCYVLPWSIAIFYVKNVMGNSPPLRILDTSDTY